MDKPRFKIGETVYISSMNDGIVERKVVAVFKKTYSDFEQRFHPRPELYFYEYALDRTVRVNENWIVGTFLYGKSKRSKLKLCPARQVSLMRIGDNIYKSHPIFIGEFTDEILTKNHINQDESQP